MNSSIMNTSMSCEEQRYIGKTSLSTDTEAILRYLLIGYLLLLFPFSVILNGFLILLMAVVKTLHQTVYFLTLQVVLIDITLTIVATPVTVVSAFAGRWIMGPEFCSLSIFIIHIFRHARYWMMFVFVSDRFISVFCPFSYGKYQAKMVIFLSLLAWTVSFIFAILPITLDCEVFSRIAFYCTGGNGCTDRYLCQSSRIVTIMITNAMGSFLPLILYAILFIKAKKLQKTLIVSKVATDASLQKRRNNLRINITFVFLFLALFGVTIVPFLFFIVGTSVFSALGTPSPPGFVISTIFFRSLYNILPIMDAIAIMRNTDFRLAMTTFKNRILKKDKPVFKAQLSASKIPTPDNTSTPSPTSVH